MAKPYTLPGVACGTERTDHRWEEDARRAAEFLCGVTEGACIGLMATIAAKGSILKSDVLGPAQAKDRIFSGLTGLERIQLKGREYTIGCHTNLRERLRREHLWIDEMKKGLARAPDRVRARVNRTHVPRSPRYERGFGG